MASTRNFKLLGKLAFISTAMFGFGYMLVPIYYAICEATGINVLAFTEQTRDDSLFGRKPLTGNTQVDKSRILNVEFDANVSGPWRFKPEVRSMNVHPGELVTVMYEFENVQNRTMSAQAIPSYAPQLVEKYFKKLECFCFNQYTLAPGEKKRWPVVFFVDPAISADVKDITLSYTFFEVGAKTPLPPTTQLNPASKASVRTQNAS